MCSIRKQVIIFCSTTNPNFEHLNNNLPLMQTTNYLNQFDADQAKDESSNILFDIFGFRNRHRDFKKKPWKSMDQSEGSESAWEHIRQSTSSIEMMVNDFLESGEAHNILRSEEGMPSSGQHQGQAVIEHALSLLKNEEDRVLDDLATCYSEETNPHEQIQSTRNTLTSSSILLGSSLRSGLEVESTILCESMNSNWMDSNWQAL